MTPYSGVFTTVTHTMRGGARYFVFTSNQGTSSEKIFNSIDQKRTLKLGMNNGGNIVKGDGGNKLTRYRASTTGPYGVLSVN